MEKNLSYIKKSLKVFGFYAILDGVFINTSENMIAAQKTWDEEDPARRIDFPFYPFWITTNDGADPEGFNSIEEALKFVEEEE